MGADADAAEFASFVRARGAALIRTAYLLTGDQQLAEDLVQTAPARTHLAWRRPHAVGNAEAYARKVMYHHQVSVWRRRGSKREVVTDTLPESWGADESDATALRLAMRAALDGLTPRQRAVLVLRFYEDRSEKEAAALLGCAAPRRSSASSRR